MADAHTAAKALLLAAGRDSTVAAAAGITTVDWAGRVMPGNRDGYAHGLHRGRLPALEIFQNGDTWTQLTAQEGGSGTMQASWTLRAHSGLPDQDLAEEQVRRIVYAALIKVREQGYFRIGEDTIETFDETPLGYSISVTVTVQTTMSRETYETTPSEAVGDVPDGGDVGGISKTINWNDASPVSILALPAGQAIATVQAKVITAFNGDTPSLTIGVDGEPDRYLASDESDLTLAPSVWERDADDAGPRTVKVWVAPGAGATQGQVSIQIIATAST